ncbi:hypothetical protein [Dyadobacter sp. CY312]|uniref:hypothetical protein n=1 Tax=Dyadobacter sp. CY312 TaxID=2907303 RepID=UPI001F2B7959|nr:hypothetical protein [Dyadobacter sp. CY312]MCE7044415.1 hypothetical protein [Dyadobacter sp. CY312]
MQIPEGNNNVDKVARLSEMLNFELTSTPFFAIDLHLGSGQQEKEIKEDIDHIINLNTELQKEVEIISSIPGVAELTVAIILAETNGFELVRNKEAGHKLCLL